MKNKAKTPTPSTTIIIDSNNSSEVASKNISFIDNKKEYKYLIGHTNNFYKVKIYMIIFPINL